MIEKKIQLSLIATAVAGLLSGCNLSNEQGLKEQKNISQIDTSLVCSYPDTIKADSFGEPILNEAGALQCERVPLECSGQTYNPVQHSCEAKGRHENAPLEITEATPAYREAEGEEFATLFFWRPDISEADVDSDLIIHAWNNADCNAYDPDYQEPGATQDPENNEYWGTDWQTGLKPDGFDPNYGVYWTFRLLEEHTDCFNFIVHEGNIKTPIDEDMRGTISDANVDRMNYVAVGSTNQPLASIYPYYSEPGDPTDGVRAISTEMAGHWFDVDTVMYNNSDAEVIRLYAANTKAKLFPGEGYRGVNYVEFTRNEGALNDAQKARALYRQDMTTFTSAEAIDPELAKEMLRGRVTLIALDANGEMIAGNLIQTAGVLDALYTMGDMDADEATLGITYEGDTVTAAVWAPTALNVKLKLYNDKDESGEYTSAGEMAMNFDSATGIWSYQGTRADLDRKLFRYEVNVFHHQDDEFVTTEVIDPYAVSVTSNGRYARFLDLSDEDLKPQGWDDHVIPTVDNPEDIIVYEGHIRDFSILDESTPAEYRGKYLAFTAEDSDPVNHLKSLADAGLNMFQILPANDIASINEDENARVELTDTVGDLCAVWDGFEACSYANEGVVIKDLLETLDPQGEKAVQLQKDLRGLDGFNWGYDPYVYNAPEGSYASNPEDTSRIIEMRAMVQALHGIGLRTSLDVVYNHTNSTGLWDNSVLDKIVPGYYYRRDVNTGDVLTETCCQDTAAENVMFAKLMTDSLVSWSANFKFDAFRFDLMNFLDKDDLLAARDAVAAVDADTYFYGEGWNYGAVASTGGTQGNMAGTEIGTFSDVQRDGVRYAALFNSDGNANDVDQARIGLVANISDYTLKSASGVFGELNGFNKPGQAMDPADTINYVDKHDNETLWDQLQYNLPEYMGAYDRTRIHAVAGSFPLFSQGIPFIQMGSDLLRSKSMDRNSYDSGDWLNKVDFTKQSNNWNVSLPIEVTDADRAKALLANSNLQVGSSEIELASELYKEFLKIRTSSKLFRLTTAEQIKDRVGFHNLGSNQTHGVVVMSIDDGVGCLNAVQDFEGNCDESESSNMREDLDTNYDAMVVVFNGTTSEQTMTVPTASGFTLHTVQQSSYDSTTTSANFYSDENNGYFTVPALTTAVFAKVQNGAQGEGLNSLATIGRPDVPPYGTTVVYMKGEMNGWSDNDDYIFNFIGNSSYAFTTELTAGTYGFKVANTDWSYPNIGGAVSFNVGDTATLGANGDNNSLTIDENGSYTFVLNAAERNMPTLTVRKAVEKPTYGQTSVYIRGTVNAGGGWNTNDPMVFTGNGMYVTSIYLTTGDYAFKMASEDWSTVNLGASGATATLGNALTLSGTDNGDISLSIAEDGEYVFAVDTSDASAPVLTVSKDNTTYPGTTVYAKGSFNGWSDNADHTFTYYGNGYYVLNIDAETIGAGAEFKIASSDWSTIDFGMDADITLGSLGQVVDLARSGSNINFEVSGSVDLSMLLHVTDDSAHKATIQVIDLAEYEF